MCSSYSEIESKVADYRHKLFVEWVNNNPDIEYKIGDIVTRHVYENGKKLFNEHLHVSDVCVDNEGNLRGYFLYAITPTCRVSKTKCMYYVPSNRELTYWAEGGKYKEKLTPYCDSIEEYKKMHYKKK